MLGEKEKARRQTPEYQAAAREYQRNYRKKNPLKIKEYRDRPESKARQKKWEQRPENKARRATKAKTPKAKATRAISLSKWKARPDVMKRNKDYFSRYHEEVEKPKRGTDEYKAYAAANQRKVRRRAKAKVLAHFGGKCQCECGCDESNPKLMTLGHPNNDGKEDRSKRGRSGGLWEFLVEHNFVHPYRLQLECWNCNMGKRMNKNVCPSYGDQ